ncbi:VOC family protein [Capilliphycus salinus ALCB114379]|uniref:VOC family protein n=1 Tax=Capilliphycus salinus TaxID=2768948 RepID=UPI0039A5B2DC
MSPPPLSQQITFLYTENLEKSAQFYESQLNLKLWLDQGTCRIYHVCGEAYVGLCQTSQTQKVQGQQPNVIFTLVTQQVDEWYLYLQKQGVEFDKPPTYNEKYKIYHCFLRDPNGYLIEIQRFDFG